MVKGKDINILMIVGQFYPLIGGAEKECQKLSKRLMEMGISVTVLTQYCQGLPEYEVIDGIPVYRKIKGWHLFEPTYMISVLHFLLKHRKKYDIIQCFGLYLFIPPALLVRYLLRKRIVARLECAGRFGDFWRIDQLSWKKLVTVSSRQLDRIIFISRDIEKELIDRRFLVGKLAHIPNSVEVNRFAPTDENINGSLKTICFVGRLHEQKGVEYLIKAINIVRAKEEEIKLFIIGDGPLRGRLEELSRKLHLEHHVDFIGSVNNVLSYYQSAHIFVLPSIAEGLPLTLLEAMACELPVIVTSVGGNMEIVDPGLEKGKIIDSDYYIGENGILVNAEDAKGLAEAVLKLFGDKELSKKLGTKARMYVEKKFSLDKIIDEYVNLYQSLF